MLTRIQLENFKSWRELDIKLAPITILFGTNSSGKTAILQSLLLLKQTANSFDRKQHINFGGGERDYVDFGSWRDLVYGHDENQKVTLGWGFNLGENVVFTDIDYQITWRQIASFDDILVERLAYKGRFRNSQQVFIDVSRQSNGSYLYVSSMPDSETSTIFDFPPDSCYIIPFSKIHTALTDNTEKFADHFRHHPNYHHYFEAIFAQIRYLGPLRQHPKRVYQWSGTMPNAIEPDGEHTIATLIASERSDDSIHKNVSLWLAKMDLTDEFRVQELDADKRFYETVVQIKSFTSSLLDVGFGVSQVLPIVTMLFFVPEESIILLEQPELHLHPNAQAVLADLLLHVAEERKLQLIVESHSEHLLTRLQRRIAETEHEFANPDNIKMYFCQTGENGSTIESVDADKYGQIKNWPKNFFGDMSGDLDALTDAALSRREQELLGSD